MAYALVTGGVIQAVRYPGRWEIKLSDGARLSPPEDGWTPQLAALCGFVPIVEVARPADTPTHTHDRTVALLVGVPTEVWTQRAKTAGELAADTQQANRATIDAQFLAYIAGADTAIANMQAVIDSPQPSFVNLAQALTQMQALTTAVKQVATTEREHIKKTVALARYVSNNLDSLAGTT